MILRIGEEKIVLAVDQRMERALGTSQELLDDDGVPGIAKNLLNHDFADRRLGFCKSLRDHHSFAESKPISLDDQWICRCTAMRQGGLRVREGGGSCCRDSVTEHEFLGK